ncbi:MAG: hypothetical protein ACXQTP_06975 [Candidatus Methanofastidiosia archaeon]
MKRKHVTTKQALAFSFCPKKYYLKYVEELSLPPTEEMVWGMISQYAREAFYKNEYKYISQLEKDFKREKVDAIYSELLDFALASAISKSSKNIKELDFEEIANYLKEDTKNEILLRKIRCLAYSKHFGFFGEELAYYFCYPPEYVRKRIVDFKHRISGRISLIIRQKDTYFPLYFNTGKPPLEGIREEYKILLRMNALLLSYEFEIPVCLSLIHYTRINKTRCLIIEDRDKEDIKKFVDNVLTCKNFNSNTMHCTYCEYNKVCDKKG